AHRARESGLGAALQSGRDSAGRDRLGATVGRRCRYVTEFAAGGWQCIAFAKTAAGRFVNRPNGDDQLRTAVGQFVNCPYGNDRPRTVGAIHESPHSPATPITTRAGKFL